MESWTGPGSVTESGVESGVEPGVEMGVEMAVESMKKIKRQMWTMAGMMERMRAQLETAGGSKRESGVVVKGGLA